MIDFKLLMASLAIIITSQSVAYSMPDEKTKRCIDKSIIECDSIKNLEERYKCEIKVYNDCMNE